MINYLLEYSGTAKRSGDLFSNKDMLGEAKQLWKKTFKNVPNIYTQHQPYILNIIDQINKGKLRESEYGTTNGPVNFKERFFFVFTLDQKKLLSSLWEELLMKKPKKLPFLTKNPPKIFSLEELRSTIPRLFWLKFLNWLLKNVMWIFQCLELLERKRKEDF